MSFDWGLFAQLSLSATKVLAIGFGVLCIIGGMAALVEKGRLWSAVGVALAIVYGALAFASIH